MEKHSCILRFGGGSVLMEHIKRIPLSMKCTLFMLFCWIGMASAQNLTVKGTVLDTAGEPVIGASILVKGTTDGVISDIDGNFTLSNVAPDATLIISFVGYNNSPLKIQHIV